MALGNGGASCGRGPIIAIGRLLAGAFPPLPLHPAPQPCLIPPPHPPPLAAPRTWGPHAAALYGSQAAFDHITAAPAAAAAAPPGAPDLKLSSGPNHYFIPSTSPPYWFELGGVSHEACAGVNAIGRYLRTVAAAAAAAAESAAPAAAEPEAGAPPPPLRRDEVEAAFAVMEELEAPHAAPIIRFLAAHPRAILIGPGALEGARGGGGGGDLDVQEDADAGWAHRVPTISFVHTSKTSKQVAAEVQVGLGVRK